MQRSRADGFGRWLGSPVESFTRASGGLSSETYIADAGPRGKFVLRLAPEVGLFPEYDLGTQARLQAELPALGVASVPPTAYVDDAQWLGRPFLVMPFVEGHVLADKPAYYRKGWLHDAAAEVQRTVLTGFVDTLAAIHRLDWRQCSFVARDDTPGLESELAYWERYLDWSGATDRLAPALTWCRDHRPRPEPPPSLLWGDVRLGNMIFGDDGAPAAVLDWEMASVGPAEVDLGWFLALRPSAGPELPGFPDRAATLDHYQHALRREISDLAWYETFALLRSTAVLMRTQRVLAETGQADHWLVGIDPMPAELKGLTA